MMSRNNRLATNNECEIELQMNTMLTFKYYGHHAMSRKFKYRYIESITGSAILPIISNGNKKSRRNAEAIYAFFGGEIILRFVNVR